MNKYYIFSGFIGFVIGAIAGGGTIYVRQKRKYEKILEEYGVNDIPEDRSIEIEKARKKFFEEQHKADSEENSNDGKEDEELVYNLSEIKAKLKKNKQVTTDYAKMYSAGELVDTKAEQGEPDPEEEADGEDEEEKDERTASNIFKEIKKNYGRAPRIVKEEDVDDEHEGWDISSLFLYSNGVVTDEDDNVIDGEELETMVGDCLTKYDFVHSNEKIIYVQCFKLNTFYEINKFNKPFDS
ncbi:MAG: hypothetical protein J6Y02_23920 [Pseudobutyrivibrio sp.]|nr:hypothetical protein [Pseudobutyrivibrio sp.]